MGLERNAGEASEIDTSQCAGLEVFTAVTMKNTLLWDVAPCSCCVNQKHNTAVTTLLSMVLPEMHVKHYPFVVGYFVLRIFFFFGTF
jgi:hypothetical protein